MWRGDDDAWRCRSTARRVIPYGIGDAAIGIATVPMPELLAELGG
ncbi:MAG: hypothetical protein WAL26_22345 [Mycobacterium sp.]